VQENASDLRSSEQINGKDGVDREVDLDEDEEGSEDEGGAEEEAVLRRGEGAICQGVG
jgi:hypothetical protein